MLIKCPECGNMVSDLATHCPSCGCPIHNMHNAQKDDGTPDLNQDSCNMKDEQHESLKHNDKDLKSKSAKYSYDYKPKKGMPWWKGCLIGCLTVIILVLLISGGIVIGCFSLLNEGLKGAIEASNTTYTQTDDTTVYEPDSLALTPKEVQKEEPSKQSTNGHAILKGILGGSQYAMTMSIHFKDNGDVSGIYHYDKSASSEQNLTGNYQDPYLTLYEYDSEGKQTGIFEGKYDGETFAGTYTGANKKEYAFSLKVDK